MSLKFIALTTTPLLALGLSATPAEAGAMGTVSMGTGLTWQDHTNDGEDSVDLDDNFANIFGSAKVNIPYSSTVNLQLDAIGDAAFANETDDDNFGASFGLAAHINYRDESGLLGVFGSVARAPAIDDDTPTVTAFGIEGQLFCGQWTVLGQIGYLDSGEEDDAAFEGDYFNSAGYIQAGAHYYVHNNLRLTGTLAYAAGEQDENDTELLEWVLGGEYLFSQKVPAGVFVEYRGVTAEENEIDGDEVDNDTISVGVRIHFGATDLMNSDRTGASANLANVHRWSHEAGEYLD